MKAYQLEPITAGRPLSNQEVLERIERAPAQERRRLAAATGLIGLWAAVIAVSIFFVNDLGPAKPPSPTFDRQLQAHATWQEGIRVMRHEPFALSPKSASISNLAAPVKADDLTPHEIFQRLHPSVVVLHKTDLFGSTFRGTGFFIAPNLIATNYHVVKEVRNLRIEGVNGSSFTFYKVHAEDPTADTAIIEVRETSPHILNLDPISRVKVGQQVYVIGNPKGYVRSLSQGLVSGIRHVNGGPLYQVTANVAQGSSGSPVIDGNGRAIGIIFGRLENEAQIAFATPAANLAALKDGGWQPERNTGADAPTNRNLPLPHKNPVRKRTRQKAGLR